MKVSYKKEEGLLILIHLDTMRDKMWIYLNFRKLRHGDYNGKGALCSLALFPDYVDDKISETS